MKDLKNQHNNGFSECGTLYVPTWFQPRVPNVLNLGDIRYFHNTARSDVTRIRFKIKVRISGWNWDNSYI